MIYFAACGGHLSRVPSFFRQWQPLCAQSKVHKKKWFSQVWWERLYWQAQISLSSLSPNTFKINWNNRSWKSQVLSLSLPSSCRWMGAIPWLPNFCGKPSQNLDKWAWQHSSMHHCLHVHILLVMCHAFVSFKDFSPWPVAHCLKHFWCPLVL